MLSKSFHVHQTENHSFSCNNFFGSIEKTSWEAIFHSEKLLFLFLAKKTFRHLFFLALPKLLMWDSFRAVIICLFLCNGRGISHFALVFLLLSVKSIPEFSWRHGAKIS